MWTTVTELVWLFLDVISNVLLTEYLLVASTFCSPLRKLEGFLTQNVSTNVMVISSFPIFWFHSGISLGALES